MNYKAFIIAPESVISCIGTATHFSVSGARTAYQIIDPVSGYVCGIKHSLKRAQKAIDIHGSRWQSTDVINRSYPYYSVRCQ